MPEVALHQGASLTLGPHQIVDAQVSPQQLGTTEEEMREIQMILSWHKEDNNWRRQYEEKWEERLKAYKGRTWQAQKSSNQKQQPEMNLIRVIVQTILPILTDASPGFGVLPKKPADLNFVRMLGEALESQWDRLGMPIRIVEVLMDQSILDCGILKVFWNPDLEDGRGDVDIEVKDPRNIWVNKGACDFDRECKRVIERVVKTVGEWKRLFPDKAHLIRSDSGSEEKRKEEEGRPTAEVKLVSPVDRDQGLSRDPGEAISDENGYAEGWEVWYLDESVEEFELQKEDGTAEKAVKRRFPNGHLTTILPFQKILLQSVQNPNEGPNFNPYVRFVDTVMPRSFYGEGLVESVLDIQKLLNRVAQTIVEYLRLMSNPVWILDKTSGVKPDNITNKVGLIIQKEAGAEVRRDIPPPIPSYVFEFFRLLQQFADTVAGVHDVTQGRKPAGITAAEAIDSLQEAAHTRVRLKERNMNVSLSKLARLDIAIMLQRYRGARYQRVATDANEAPRFVEFGIDDVGEGQIKLTKKDWVYDTEKQEYVEKPLRDAIATKSLFDVKVQAGTALPFAKAQRSNLALKLFQAKAIDQEALLKTLEWDDAKEIIMRMQQAAQAAPPAAMAA